MKTQKVLSEGCPAQPDLWGQQFVRLSANLRLNFAGESGQHPGEVDMNHHISRIDVSRARDGLPKHANLEIEVIFSPIVF